MAPELAAETPIRVTYWPVMKRLLLASLLLLGPVALAAVPAPGVGQSVQTERGALVSADLRDEYLAGFDLLVTFTVKNTGATPLGFPDLQNRPHVVRFRLDGPKGKSERFSTPPKADPGGAWTLQPGSERKVVLAIPSSSSLTPGDWTLTVAIEDGETKLALPTQAFRLTAARPVGGRPVWEPTVANTVGTMFPWVHQAKAGFDLYLMQYAPKSTGTVQAQFFLAREKSSFDPILSRARTNDARSRHIYWATDGRSITWAHLDGTTFSAPPRVATLPYPKVELLARGVSDGNGKLVVPLWVPAPSGAGGEVRVLEVDARGRQVVRGASAYTQRPRSVTSAVDAAGNLLFAVSDAGGVGVFRVDTTKPPEVPATAARVWKSEGGWSPTQLSFDTLPQTAAHPGGLALFCLLTRPDGAGGTVTRTLWSGIDGKVFADSTAGVWTLPGEITSFLPGGYGSWYAVTRDGEGAAWFAAQNAAPVKLKGGPVGALLPATDRILFRRLIDGRVAEDEVAGPKVP